MKRILLAGYEERTRNYQDALLHAGFSYALSLDPGDVRYFDALLLPGGGDINPYYYHQDNKGSEDIDQVLDSAQMRLLEEFVKADKPVLGICRGCQVINVFFGGTLIQDLPEDQREIHTYDNGDKYHDIEAVSGSFLETAYGHDFRVNSAHHQALDQLGKGLHAAAYSKGDHVIEAVCHEDHAVTGIQWHPERISYQHLVSGVSDGAQIFRYFDSQIKKTPAACRRTGSSLHTAAVYPE